MKKGGLDLAGLAWNLEDTHLRETWQRVMERVRDGEMPPAKKPQPEAPARDSFVSAVKVHLLKADAADITANGRVRGRRLTRTEYEHTVHDLLGIDIPLADQLPEDRASHGFETVAEGQQLSQHQLARYLDVADLALTDAFQRALQGDASFKKTFTPEQLAQSTRSNYRGPELRGGESFSWPIPVQFFGRMLATHVPKAGWYRVTLRSVRAINPGPDGAVWGTLRSGVCASNAPLLYDVGLVEATAKPRDMVYEAWIQEDHILELKPNDATLKRAPAGADGGNVSFVGRNLEKAGYSGIAHRGIEIKRIYPQAKAEEVRQLLLGEVDPKLADASALDTLINRFAQRAFRRPVASEESSPYREIGRGALDEGKDFTTSLHAAYRAILCSPRFLTFIEEPGKLDDHALASRLSYSLWVSMPDAALTEVAGTGELRKPEVLRQQVERLLRDPKSKRFVHSFTDQWLKLNQIDFTNPDSKLYPGFDPVVQESMLQETRQFFTEMLTKDLSITHLIDSDFAFLNGRLARHYTGAKPAAKPLRLTKQKLGGPPATQPQTISEALSPGQGLQKVKLGTDSKRGGLLTQGAILKVTADGTTTSPVVRGVFINERILGNVIPPPPPGVPAIEPDVRGATSIRDQLEKHRASDSCVSCHLTIDPPGFALENYDPVGVWRQQYGSSSTSAKVDPSGTTPEGESFAELSSWKKLYIARPEQLARGFAHQFLTYATGATPSFSNEAELHSIAEKTQDLRSLIHAVTQSEMFRNK